jgi:hypothetical protein
MIVADTVQMHYVGTLKGGPRDGEQFDSSRKPGYAVRLLRSCLESDRSVFEQWQTIQDPDRSWKRYQRLG